MLHYLWQIAWEQEPNGSVLAADQSSHGATAPPPPGRNRLAPSLRTEWGSAASPFCGFVKTLGSLRRAWRQGG
jgi:hypothetical protein